MRITHIKDQYRNIEIVLDRNETIWNQFSCIRSKKLYVPYLTHLPNDIGKVNIIYCIRIIIATIAIVVSARSTNFIIHCLGGFVWIILSIILLLDCNYNIFLDGITTFDVYYKVINVGIGILGEYITFDWFETAPYNTQPNKHWLYTSAIIVIFANMLVVLVVSIFDGYHQGLSKVKFYIVALFIVYHCYRLVMLSIYSENSNDHTTRLFNTYTLDWKVAGLSCTFSSLAFVCKQYAVGITTNYATVVSCSIPFKSRSTVVLANMDPDANHSTLELNQRLLVPSRQPSLLSTPSTDYSAVKSDHGHTDNARESMNATVSNNSDTNIIEQDKTQINSNSDDTNVSNNDTTDNKFENMYRVPLLQINVDVSEKTEEDADTRLTTSVSAMVQQDIDQFNIEIDTSVTLLYAILYNTCHVYDDRKLEKICNILHSKQLLLIVILYIVGYLVVNLIVNLFNYAWIKLAVVVIYFLFSLIAFVSVNYQIFRYKIVTFILWWKIFDMIQFSIGMTLIDQKNDKDAWNNDNKGYNTIEAYIETVIIFFQMCFILMIALSVVDGFTYLSKSKCLRFLRNCVTLSGIFYLCRWGLQYGEANKHNFHLSLSIGNETSVIDMKHLVVLKSVDLSLWLAVQLVRQIRYADTIKWYRIIVRLQ